MKREIKRGQIYYCYLDGNRGSEQGGGLRPCLIIQNDKGNKFSPTTIIAPLTSRKTKANLPTHCWIKAEGLPLTSLVELEQIRCIDKTRLEDYVCEISANDQERIDKAIKISLGVM